MTSSKIDLSIKGLMPICQDPMNPRSDDHWFMMSEAKKTKFPLLGAELQNNADVVLKSTDVQFAAKHLYYYGKIGYRSPSSSFSLSDACLLLILEFTPLSGGEGLRLFCMSDTKPWADFFEENNISSKSMSAVYRAVKEKDASKEVESKLSDSHKKELALISENPGGFLRLCLVLYRGTFRSPEVLGQRISSTRETLATSFDVTTELVDVLNQEFVNHAAKLEAYSKKFLSVRTLMAAVNDTAKTVLEKGHFLRMRGAGLMILNLIASIAMKNAMIRFLALSCSAEEHRALIFRSVAAYEFYYAEMDVIDIAMLANFPEALRSDSESKKFGQFARCVSDSLGWLSRKKSGILAEFWAGVHDAVIPESRVELTGSSSEYRVSRDTAFLILLKRSLGTDITDERKKAISEYYNRDSKDEDSNAGVLKGGKGTPKPSTQNILRDQEEVYSFEG